MAKRKILTDPVRTRIGEMIDAEVESARDAIQRASDLAELLNAFVPESDQIEIDGNVVVGAFKKDGR